MFFLVSISATAGAQTDSKFALGADFAVKLPGGRDAHGSEGLGLLWRFGRGKEGFGFHWGLNWYEKQIDLEKTNDGCVPTWLA